VSGEYRMPPTMTITNRMPVRVRVRKTEDFMNEQFYIYTADYTDLTDSCPLRNIIVV
jgi:hypothetical protein